MGSDGLPKVGERLGRYTILEQVGEGGMGVVFAAYDERLDRRVALKLLHTGTSDSLLQEARALARLAHPNVVGVYDAQDFHGRIAVAMELVPGSNLRVWLAAQKRSSPEILRVLLEAGRGLSAAHAAGVLHRDFKPDNVLVGDDGRVRVTDFGLAQVEQAPAPSGNYAGTPGYAAPEQQAGGATDARADQFSFCVTLFEALCGRNPFVLEAKATPNAQAPVANLPDLSKLPAATPALRQALERGLSREPAARFASMDALLEVLAPPPVRAKWPRVAAVGALVLLAGGGWWGWSEQRSRECSGAAARLQGVWDEPARRLLRDNFSRSKSSFAAGAWAVTERGLDDWAARWAAAHRDACEATRRRNEQSAEVLDLRVACFERLRTEASAVVQVLATADDSVIARAPRAVAELKDVSVCADVTALSSTVPLSPLKHAERAVLLTRLADLTARRSAGKYPGLVEETLALANDARTLGWAPLVAEVLVERSWALDIAGDGEGSWKALEEAALAAEAGRAFSVLVKAYAYLVYATVDLDKLSEAELLYRHGRAVLAHAPNAERECQLESYYGASLRKQGKLADALVHGTKSIELARKLQPPLPLVLAAAANNFALTMAELDRAEDHLALMREAIEASSRVLGPAHPDVGIMTINAAIAQYTRGDFKGGLETATKGLEILERGYGGDHLRVAIALGARGKMLVEVGRIDDAIAEETRALQMRQRLLGDKHSDVGRMYSYRGEAQLAGARPALALADYEAALEILKTAVKPGHKFHIEALVGAARSQLALGKPKEALALASEAKKHLRPAELDEEAILMAELVLAQAEIANGLPKAPALARAQKAWEKLKLDPTIGNTRQEVEAWFASQL